MEGEQGRLTVELQKELDELRRSLSAEAPPEVAEALRRSAEELLLSGIAQRCLKDGERALDFALPNAVGREVRLSDVTARGPAVVTFYRGGW